LWHGLLSPKLHWLPQFHQLKKNLQFLCNSESRMVSTDMCVYFKYILRQGKMVSAQTKDSSILYDRLFSAILIISSVAAANLLDLEPFQVLWQCCCFVIHIWSFCNKALL
jgi:hypothetical protein